MTDQQTPPLAESQAALPPELDPADQRDPAAWRPTFDISRGHWFERAQLLRERDSLDHELNLYAETIAKMAARVAELESIIMCEFSRERDGERCWCSEDHIHRMIRLGQHDGRCQAIRELNIPSAALLKPAEKPS